MNLQTITQAGIEKITDPAELVKLKKSADAAAIFYKAQEDLYASQHAKEISIRSARRAGQILLNVPRENGKRTDITSVAYPTQVDTNYQKILDDTGISAFIAKSWQILARIPDTFFEEYLANAKYAKTEFSIYRLLGLAKPLFRAQFKKQQEERAQDYPAGVFSDFKINDVYVADTRSLELPENSLDMIFTDPPYHDEYLHLYAVLAELALKSLKAGGYCMTYCGKKYLPQVMNMLGEKLEYVWTYCVFQPDNSQRFMEHHIFEAWRPIVCYKKAGKSSRVDWQPDAIKGTRDKTYHEWQQQIEPPLKYIGAYTNPGDLVLDPFAGSGTTLVACQQLKRNYLGFDVDPKTVKIARMRLQDAHIQQSR